MTHINVKLRLSGKVPKYRKVLSTDKTVYPVIEELISSSVPYSPQTLLDEEEWYSLENFTSYPFAQIDLITSTLYSVDFDSLSVNEFSKIDYLFVSDNNCISFQNISKSKLVSRKMVFHIGEGFKYHEGGLSISLNDYPDAFYEKDTNTLYFKKLSSISSIFKGIDSLYRVATEQETVDFLQSDFISLNNDFSAAQVKTANRKRIAMASDTLKNLNPEDRSHVFSYIGDYCPNLKTTNHTFSISNENDLKLLLFGIEQRFYTTPVGGEKRIANSILNFD